LLLVARFDAVARSPQVALRATWIDRSTE